MNARAAQVNLLPREIGQRQRERRWAGITAVALLVWVAVLTGVYLAKLAAGRDAELERDVAAAEVELLRAEAAALQDFAALDRRLQARNDLLAAAMAGEISWARTLNDLSLTFPANSSLLTFTGAMVEQAEPAARAPDEGEAVATPEEPVAELTFTGYSVERFAPGVERLLLRIGDVRSFFNAYLTQAATTDRGGTEVTAFNGTVQLDADAYTGRYADGLPARDQP